MSKPMIAALLGAGAILAVAFSPSVNSARAADMAVKANVSQSACNDPCGCLRVSYDRHRELLTTYGTGFDPRNFDTTEPHYYFGQVRAYPQYSCDDPTVQ